MSSSGQLRMKERPAEDAPTLTEVVFAAGVAWRDSLRLAPAGVVRPEEAIDLRTR